MKCAIPGKHPPGGDRMVARIRILDATSVCARSAPCHLIPSFWRPSPLHKKGLLLAASSSNSWKQPVVITGGVARVLNGAGV